MVRSQIAWADALRACMPKCKQIPRKHSCNNRPLTKVAWIPATDGKVAILAFCQCLKAYPCDQLRFRGGQQTYVLETPGYSTGPAIIFRLSVTNILTSSKGIGSWPGHGPHLSCLSYSGRLFGPQNLRPFGIHMPAVKSHTLGLYLARMTPPFPTALSKNESCDKKHDTLEVSYIDTSSLRKQIEHTPGTPLGSSSHFG